MRMRNTSVKVQFFIENQQWVGKGPRVRVEASTLQAARRRIRVAVDEAYGEGAEIQSSLVLPQSLYDRAAKFKQWRAKVRDERTKLRDELVAIVNYMRDDLGGSYADAADLLEMDAAGLMRHAHTSKRTKLPEDDED